MRRPFDLHRVAAPVAVLVVAWSGSVPAGAAVEPPPPVGGGTDGGETVELIVSSPRRFGEEALETITGVPVESVEHLPALDAMIVEVAASHAGWVEARLEARPDVGEVHAASPVRKFAPNDPNWPRQRWMARQGFEAAWTHTTGSSNVTVAVIDTGVNVTPDLAGRVLEGRDLLRGGAARDRDDDPARHGTNVASIIAAAGNDGTGMAGACWSCRILPVKVLDGSGNGSTGAVASGITWAVDAGARIINLSLGGPVNDPLVQKAVDYAVSKGAIVVAAAGNDHAESGPAPNYPAAYPNVIGVGSWVDDIGAVYPDGIAPWSQRGAAWYEIAAGACVLDGGGDDSCGTSFSAPYVTGTLALMRSLRGDLSTAKLREVLLANAAPGAAGLRTWFRHGRLDAARALAGAKAVETPDRTPPRVALKVGAGPYGRNSTIKLSVEVSDDRALRSSRLDIGGVVVREWGRSAVRGTPSIPVSQLLGRLRDGTHTVTLSAIDAAGNRTTKTARITIDTTGPTSVIFRPTTGTRVRRYLDIVAWSSDPSGTLATFVIVDRRVVSGWRGNGGHHARIPITRNGTHHIVTITVDNLNNISASNHVYVNGRRR